MTLLFRNRSNGEINLSYLATRLALMCFSYFEGRVLLDRSSVFPFPLHLGELRIDPFVVAKRNPVVSGDGK